MKSKELTIPEIAFIAGTRGMLGAGVGLLLAGKLSKEQRRAAGLTLVVVGALTTIPLAINLFGKERKLPDIPLAAWAGTRGSFRSLLRNF
jgi:hypothetical protein